MEKEIMKLVIIALGALRDLSCGNSLNRQSIGNFTINNFYGDNTSLSSGIGIISFFVERYHGQSWETILCVPNSLSVEQVNICTDSNNDEPTERGKLELRMMTAAIGVIRNATHSTRANCEAFHAYGITNLFIWRLTNTGTNISSSENNFCHSNNESAQISRLPHASKPWREATFRIASSLINMSEKCVEVE